MELFEEELISYTTYEAYPTFTQGWDSPFIAASSSRIFRFAKRI